MRQNTLFTLAWQSILKNKMRTLLTMLGIVIGVGAVIVMVAVGQGARSKIEDQINSLGTNLIVITPGATNMGGVNQGAGTFNRLTVDDAVKLKREATTTSGITPIIVTHAQMIGPSGNWHTQVNGVSTDFFAIRNWQVADGAPFSDADLQTGRKVVLLGATVAKNLFPGEDPVGASVQVGHVPFTVIGVMAAKGQNADGQDQDDLIIVPWTTAQQRLAGRFLRLGMILASTYSPQDIPAAEQDLSGIMREAHRLGPGDPDDFTIRNQTDIANAAESTTKVMSYLLAAIASVSLLVGGIGIMNIMLVSVTERTREIGIRMAVGARGSDVLTQFLVEAIVLSVLGGIIGLAFGYGGAALLGHVTGWSTRTPPQAVGIAVGFSGAVGMFFGFYPARKAAALNPIDALRYE